MPFKAFTLVSPVEYSLTISFSWSTVFSSLLFPVQFIETPAVTQAHIGRILCIYEMDMNKPRSFFFPTRKKELPYYGKFSPQTCLLRRTLPALYRKNRPIHGRFSLFHLGQPVFHGCFAPLGMESRFFVKFIFGGRAFYAPGQNLFAQPGHIGYGCQR